MCTRCGRLLQAQAKHVPCFLLLIPANVFSQPPDHGYIRNHIIPIVQARIRYGKNQMEAEQSKSALLTLCPVLRTCAQLAQVI